MLKKFSLLPKEEKFYRLLGQLAHQARACGDHLKTYIESTDTPRKETAAAGMKACRAEAKNLSFEVTRQLCLTFVTPFDREDIQDISADLYRITKLIEKVYERLSLHKMEINRGDFSKQVNLIVQEAAVMEAMVHDLVSGAGSDKVLKKADQLRDLENEGDTVLSELLGELFRGTTDARELILRKDIYDMLEKVIDGYRDLASIAISIVLKYS
jgi:uncharacterized protein Yka (UPF0111/DUF47 family)